MFDRIMRVAFFVVGAVALTGGLIAGDDLLATTGIACLAFSEALKANVRLDAAQKERTATANAVLRAVAESRKREEAA